MSLKQSIVIVNEFSVKQANGTGTRGSTPGAYVERYMARDWAVEDLTPVRLKDTDVLDTLYEARRESAKSHEHVEKMKDDMRDAQGDGGIAFSRGMPSMSSERVKSVSRQIQQAFDNGKTVLKTVISFDTDYLRRRGIIDDEAEWEYHNGWRGKVDQMKLRLAISHGIDRMSAGFDDLLWIGCIQVDAKHVHCHLAMVDMGVGRLRADGHQTGKLTQTDMNRIRRFTDYELAGMSPVAHLASNVTHDKRNIRCLVKGRLHEIMRDRGLPQFLLACLPEDKRLWRARTNNKDMRKANELTREFVSSVLLEPGSGWTQARRDIATYTHKRADLEGLTASEVRKLQTDGEDRIIYEAMDGVYMMLRNITPAQRQVETSMMDVMSMDAQQMAAATGYDPVVEFGFKLRSYSSRLRFHRDEWRTYADLAHQWEEALPASEPSRALYEFYQEEASYNAKCMAKYQHFLAFLPVDGNWREEVDEYTKLAQACADLEAMLDDPSLQRMGQDSAEDYGLRVYHQRGASLVAKSSEVVKRRLDDMQDRLSKMRDQVSNTLAGSGFALLLSWDGEEQTEEEELPWRQRRLLGYRQPQAHPQVIHELAYDFDEVKALDLHHLGWDFAYDADVSNINAQAFIDQAYARAAAAEGARQYLEGSHQEKYLDLIPEGDIMRQLALARQLDTQMDTGVSLPSARAEAAGKRHVKTISLGQDLTRNMRHVVQATLAAQQLDNYGLGG